MPIPPEPATRLPAGRHSRAALERIRRLDYPDAARRIAWGMSRPSDRSGSYTSSAEWNAQKDHRAHRDHQGQTGTRRTRDPVTVGIGAAGEARGARGSWAAPAREARAPGGFSWRRGPAAPPGSPTGGVSDGGRAPMPSGVTASVGSKGSVVGNVERRVPDVINPEVRPGYNRRTSDGSVSPRHFSAGPVIEAGSRAPPPGGRLLRRRARPRGPRRRGRRDESAGACPDAGCPSARGGREGRAGARRRRGRVVPRGARGHRPRQTRRGRVDGARPRRRRPRRGRDSRPPRDRPRPVPRTRWPSSALRRRSTRLARQRSNSACSSSSSGAATRPRRRWRRWSPPLAAG